MQRGHLGNLCLVGFVYSEQHHFPPHFLISILPENLLLHSDPMLRQALILVESQNFVRAVSDGGRLEVVESVHPVSLEATSRRDANRWFDLTVGGVVPFLPLRQHEWGR
jgi:hypothetical protein